MKAVHFGAGNIGRGFIGLLLSQSGFEVTFVARNEKKVQLLQQQKRYSVTLANEARDTELVRNISAVNSKDAQKIANEIAEADLVTTAVGLGALAHIAESIAAGIELRLLRGNRKPLHVIACENAIDGSTQLKRRILKHISEDMRKDMGETVAFPCTAVDRIVPAQADENPLRVTVEPYFEWVIDRSTMLEGFPKIDGVKYVDDLEPYIERKLFTVNTGHCVAAYHGYLEGYETIQEVMKDSELRGRVINAMNETGELLRAKYHWDKDKHSSYIERMARRFANPRLRDEIVRVGRSPLRKLSLNDRLIRPAMQAHRLGLGTESLTEAIAAAMMFDHKDDPEAVQLQNALRLRGADEVVTQYMGIPQKHALHQNITSKYYELKHQYGPAIASQF
ncbi:mannitol-1-phosphate 5-dehydrogenase [Paenibacillus sp. CAU 1782]